MNSEGRQPKRGFSFYSLWCSTFLLPVVNREMKEITGMNINNPTQIKSSFGLYIIAPFWFLPGLKMNMVDDILFVWNWRFWLVYVNSGLYTVSNSGSKSSLLQDSLILESQRFGGTIWVSISLAIITTGTIHFERSTKHLISDLIECNRLIMC